MLDGSPGQPYPHEIVALGTSSGTICGMSAWQLLLLVFGILIALAVLAGLSGRHFVRRGVRTPWMVRRVNQVSDRVVATIRRPITVAVLDEVADVLRTGHYTRNIAAALRENEEEIKTMIAEKVKSDPTTRAIGLLPFHDRIIDLVSETTLRVILEVLADPRTDELVSDLLRENLVQLREAVHSREHETPGDFEPPNPQIGEV